MVVTLAYLFFAVFQLATGTGALSSPGAIVCFGIPLLIAILRLVL